MNTCVRGKSSLTHPVTETGRSTSFIPTAPISSASRSHRPKANSAGCQPGRQIGRAFFVRWLPRRECIVGRDLETGREKELYRAASPASVSHLAMSPDGQLLAFLWRDQRAGKTALMVIPTTGGKSRELTTLPTPELSG